MGQSKENTKIKIVLKRFVYQISTHLFFLQIVLYLKPVFVFMSRRQADKKDSCF